MRLDQSAEPQPSVLRAALFSVEKRENKNPSYLNLSRLIVVLSLTCENRLSLQVSPAPSLIGSSIAGVLRH